MKNYPLLFLISASAFSQAQSHLPIDREASAVSLGISYADVSHDVVDYDGYVLGARFRVVQDFYVTAGWTSASTGVVGVAEYDLEVDLDVDMWSLGFEYEIPSGPGKFTLSLAYSDGALEGYVSDGTGLGALYTGDIIENSQIILGARYDLPVGDMVKLGFALTHFKNDFSFVNGLSSLGSIRDKSVTAPKIELSIQPTKMFSLSLAYSTEDILLGLPEADGAFTLGAKLHF
jgi:hypothetical protein